MTFQYSNAQEGFMVTTMRCQGDHVSMMESQIVDSIEGKPLGLP